MSPGPVLTALRAATRTAHDRLEHRLDALNNFAAPARRRALVGRYYSLHVPAEAQLAPWLASIAELDFVGRRRGPMIVAAMAELAIAAPARSMAPRVPPLRGGPEALGFLYVLEGSALGGRVILRTLARRGVDLSGLSFLDPYRDLAAERWAGFVRVLEREAGVDDRAIDSAVSGGKKGFGYAEACLCGDAVPA